MASFDQTVQFPPQLRHTFLAKDVLTEVVSTGKLSVTFKVLFMTIPGDYLSNNNCITISLQR